VKYSQASKPIVITNKIRTGKIRFIIKKLFFLPILFPSKKANSIEHITPMGRMKVIETRKI